MHLPSEYIIQSWPTFTRERPLRVLVSACLAGERCGVDGTSYGEDVDWIKNFLGLPEVQAVRFCPEQFSFGTPRRMPDIHGGNGFDVLDGKARVLNDAGEDWTEGMIKAAAAMLRSAQEHRIDLALLMDMSAACGSQVISDGGRLVAERRYQKGPGVAAALLLRHGFWVVSQRDFRTWELIRRKLDPAHPVDLSARDHHETVWYRAYFA